MAEPILEIHEHAHGDELDIHDHPEVQGDPLSTMRHSTAHIMAEAVLSIFPDAKIGIGPVIEHGFYYDFLLPRALSPEDLTAIEARMREIIAADTSFVKTEISKDEARGMFADQPFKVELISEIGDELVRIYNQGGFTDLCRGPHLNSTKQVGAFKLLSIAGAYWRGKEDRPMLQRIYGAAFFTQKELDAHLKWLEEVARRDHRRLGRELDLFSTHEEAGPGMIYWHPKGARIRGIIEDLWRAEHYRRDYSLVVTPHVGKSWLWETSGHLGFYKENMFDAMDMDGLDYYIKPMNCPFHIMIYRNALRSYRELPLRFGELGTVYRFERAGVLHGLMRVRGFTQDDAHIFCRPDQVEDEVVGVLDMMQYFLSLFGFNDVEVFVSTKPEKAVGRDEDWDMATQALQRAVDRVGWSYKIDAGGGAFYGPKVDVKIKDALGRTWQCSTVQFDFNEPERFGLEYIGADGQPHRPVMVHRAILGSMERFFGVLVEHFGGAFPVWLAPVQATVIPIADRHIEYAQQVMRTLKGADIRAEVDARSERMNYKIREAQTQKVPYMLVVGDNEAAAGTVSVRLRSGENLGALSLDDVQARIAEEVKQRS